MIITNLSVEQLKEQILSVINQQFFTNCLIMVLFLLFHCYAATSLPSLKQGRHTHTVEQGAYITVMSHSKVQCAQLL